MSASMSRSKLLALFSTERPPGIYRFTSRLSPASVKRAAEKAGWRCFYLDGREIHDKATFLQACAAEMEFPAYARLNWDAFEECVNDLSWAPAQGYIVLFDRAGQFEANDPRAWTTAMDILQEAIAAWRASDVPFFVLLRGADAIHLEL